MRDTIGLSLTLQGSLLTALRRLRPGKSSGLDSIFPEFTPRRVGSQILVLRFPHFLHAPNQNSKDCYPKGKTAGAPKDLSPYITAVCPLQNPVQTQLCSCRINHQPIVPTGIGGLSTREVDRRPGHPADTGHRR